MRELIRIEHEDDGGILITKAEGMSWFEVLGVLIRMQDFVRGLFQNKPQQQIVINNDISKIEGKGN